MSRNNPDSSQAPGGSRSAQDRTLAPSKAQVPPSAKPKESMRDFVEQIVVAFILAFLIRGFDAEAFVIPTGSMAPTLMGRHKEIYCPQCGHQYSIDTSDETEKFIKSRRLPEVGVCGNCRFKTDVDATPSFKGDRILVMKFPYEMPFLPGSAGPKRWDVVVFHYPVIPETNYIKRLVGLPGDDLRINHGDIQTRPIGTNDAFKIERKPLIHQNAMQVLVYDDAHRPQAFAGKTDWQRWRTGSDWSEPTSGTFQANSTEANRWADLRYRHLIPDPEQWSAVERGSTLPRGPRASLITDFYSYNTNISRVSHDLWLQTHDCYLQPNWVGDLTLAGHLRVDSVQPQAKLRLELVEAGISHRCEIDLNTGTATLFRGDEKLKDAPTSIKGVGDYEIKFANVDDRLTLWVDGDTPFGAGVEYDILPNGSYLPTDRDLDPVGVGVQAAKVAVSGLVLQRDIYYTQDPRGPDYKVPGVFDSSDRDDPNEYARVVKLFDFLSDPSRFHELENIVTRDPFSIRPGHYMMMGDNSPRSSDSRVWDNDDAIWRTQERLDWEVPANFLIGKAFFIYWPHGKPFGPDIRINRDLRIPFRPYFERMKWIR